MRYVWIDDVTNISVEVNRSLAEIDLPPEAKECDELTDEEFVAAKWRRSVSTAAKHTRSANFGTKGNW